MLRGRRRCRQQNSSSFIPNPSHSPSRLVYAQLAVGRTVVRAVSKDLLSMRNTIDRIRRQTQHIFRRRNKLRHAYRRSLHLESLEERQLLSADPLTPDRFEPNDNNRYLKDESTK